MLATCARLRLHCCDRFPTFLESFSNQSGLNILVLSRYDSDSIRAAIAKLEAAGNQTVFHLLEGGGR